jgi:hypothetical protein
MSVGGGGGSTDQRPQFREMTTTGWLPLPVHLPPHIGLYLGEVQAPASAHLRCRSVPSSAGHPAAFCAADLLRVRRCRRARPEQDIPPEQTVRLGV